MVIDSKRMTLARHWWQQGIKENLSLNANGSLVLKDSLKRGFFFSRSLDMTESAMTYHRLLIDCTLNQDSSMRISVRASDAPYIIYGGTPLNFDDFLSDTHISIENKMDFFNDRESISHYKTTDILLHKLKGRYLWVMISVFDMSGAPVEFRSISIELLQSSFVQYLPEIYQNNNEFLTRYLSIFQSIYVDMERNIDILPELLDIDSSSPDLLNYLGAWLGAYNEGSILKEEQFRFIVKNAIKLNRTKGTVKSIVDLVKLYTGEEPYIIEYFELKKYVEGNTGRERLYKEIYTDNPHVFCIVIKISNELKNYCRLGELVQLIERVRPAHTIAKIIELKPGIRLDMHSYIGINTTLEKHSAASINDNSSLDGSFYLMA